MCMMGKVTSILWLWAGGCQGTGTLLVSVTDGNDAPMGVFFDARDMPIHGDCACADDSNTCGCAHLNLHKRRCFVPLEYHTHLVR
jgi:hypothetical protein